MIEFTPAKRAKEDLKDCRFQMVMKKKLLETIKSEAKALGISANAYCTQILAYYLREQGKYADID